MNREGHLGASLLYFLPFAVLLVFLDRIELVTLGYVVIFFTFMLPDYDMKIPFLSHRKISHSIFASVFIGLFFLVLTVVVYYSTPSSINEIYTRHPLELILFMGVMGFLTMMFHILGDIYTPTGVPLLAPFDYQSYTFDLFRFDNLLANYLFLLAGVLSLVGIIGLILYTNVNF